MKKKIVITGASSGIGEATARRLHADGHQLFVTARRAESLEPLRRELGSRIFTTSLDVTDAGLVRARIHQAAEQMGGIDVLINNAGMGVFDPVAEGKLEDWHQMVDTNVKGLLSCLHAALPFLMHSRGHVINLGSVASHQVFPNSGIYCATKHAVFAISESIRLELADKVRVTTISPGSVNTPFIDSTKNPKLLSDYKSYFAAGMSPELIAEQIAWAVSCPESAVISEIIVRPNRAVR